MGFQVLCSAGHRLQMIPCPGAATEGTNVVSPWPEVTKAKETMKTEIVLSPYRGNVAVVKHSVISTVRAKGCPTPVCLGPGTE